MARILIVGATRGLGASLASKYASSSSNTVYGTARSGAPSDPVKSVTYLTGIDVSKSSVGKDLVAAYKSAASNAEPVDTLIVSAGYFGKESFDEPDFDAEVTMYKTSAIGPVFVVQALVKAGLLREGSGKVILVSSESGSITLRHESEGGGNYAHHASKAALNMVGKLLSLDLKEKGIAVGMVHPGFMRTEMTRGVGFDKFWDSGGAVTPEEAAKSLIEFIDKFDMKQTGEYWAPRGAADIGTAESILGPKDSLPTPLQLPW